MNEIIFKVVVLGGIGVGKTSIVRRYVHGIYTENYKTTIGVDFAQKMIRNDNELYKINLYDISGQERYGNMTRIYYKSTDAAIIVYDLSRNSTLEEAIKWKNDLDNKIPVSVPTILVGNKSDKYEIYNEDMIRQICKDNGFISFFTTSASSGTNIDDIFDFIIKTIPRKNIKEENIVHIDLKMDKNNCC